MLGRNPGVSFPTAKQGNNVLINICLQNKVRSTAPTVVQYCRFLSLKTPTFLVYSAPIQNVGTLHHSSFDACQTIVSRSGRLKGRDSPWRDVSIRELIQMEDICICSCSKAVYNPVWHIPLPSVQWINSWWWTEELFETCRVSCQNKFVKLMHLFGFIIR